MAIGVPTIDQRVAVEIADRLSIPEGRRGAFDFECTMLQAADWIERQDFNARQLLAWRLNGCRPTTIVSDEAWRLVCSTLRARAPHFDGAPKPRFKFGRR